MTKRDKGFGKGKTVLHAAAKNGFGEIIRYLTTSFPPPAPIRRPHGTVSTSSPNFNNNRYSVEMMGNNGEKMAEASVKIIEEALRGIDPAVRDNSGRTPLHYAAMVLITLFIIIIIYTFLDIFNLIFVL